MNESLNIRIAKLMGCKVEWQYSEADKAGGWVFVSADGTDRGVLCTKPEYAWTAAPDVEHSFDALLGLLPKNFDVFIEVADEAEKGIIYTAHLSDADAPVREFDKSWAAESTIRREAAALAFEDYLIWKAKPIEPIGD